MSARSSIQYSEVVELAKSRTLSSMGLRWIESRLYILDQQALPHDEIWISIHSAQEMVDAIKYLKVRGAPLIGVAACMAMLVEVIRGASFSEVQQAWANLGESRPTAINLRNNLQELAAGWNAENYQLQVAHRALNIFDQDVALCDRMASNGADLIAKNETLLTHCNTGGLATVGCGTALGVIAKAKALGKNNHVYVDETRPLLQGGRLTTWELGKLGIAYTLNTDSMAAYLMQQKKIDRVLLGSDRICRNGDFANKVGSYALAVQCHYHGIPFHVVAPMTTYDRHCATGAEIPIEQRDADEVRGFVSHRETKTWAPREAAVYNPSFDVTPAALVTSFITDTGVYSPQEWQKLTKGDV